MKYEFRKTAFAKLIILLLAAIAEVLFLLGQHLGQEDLTSTGTLLLVLIATFGIMYVGIDSLLVLNRDLNTKQGYMLFMTPKNSYEILGAKILENGLSILLAGAFFTGLAWIDLTILLKRMGEQYSVLKMLQDFLNSLPVRVEFSFRGLSTVFFAFLVSWLATVVIAAFAIILSSSLFTGKKFNIILSFAIFFAISFAMSFATSKLPYRDPYTYYLLRSAVDLIFAAVIYFLSCRIMEKKLSL